MDNKFSFELLENSLDFIDMAVDQIESKNPTNRQLKYALLHLSSGVELLFKYSLLEEHWSLLFHDVNDAEYNKFYSGDFKSVDSKNSLTRLENICGIKFNHEADKHFQNLRSKRNKLEHFGISDNTFAVKSIVLITLNYVFEFILNQIDEDLISDNETILLDSIRSKLFVHEEFIKKRLQRIKSEVDEFNYSKIISCPSCNQLTLPVDGEKNQCLFCEFSNNPKELMEDYIFANYEAYSYYDPNDLNSAFEFTCPECDEDTFICIDDDYVCFSCGEIYSSEKTGKCDTCGVYYHQNEGDIGMCQNCIEYRIQ